MPDSVILCQFLLFCKTTLKEKDGCFNLPYTMWLTGKGLCSFSVLNAASYKFRLLESTAPTFFPSCSHSCIWGLNKQKWS